MERNSQSEGDHRRDSAHTAPEPSRTSPGNTPPTAVCAAPCPESSQPGRRGSSLRIVVLVIAVLTLVAFGVWRAFSRPPGPEEVVERFSAALERHDIEGAKSCLSRSSLSILQAVPDDKNFLAAWAFGAKVLKTVSRTGDKVILQVKPTGKSGSAVGSTDKQEFVIVSEDRQWKVDLPQTIGRRISQLVKSGRLRQGSG